MANKSKNIFVRLAKFFKDIRSEAKKSVWPTKEKLKQTSFVVLAVILFFAVFLALIKNGSSAILNQIGFYDQIETTTTAVTTAATTAETTVALEETSDETTSETSEETTEATTSESAAE